MDGIHFICSQLTCPFLLLEKKTVFLLLMGGRLPAHAVNCSLLKQKEKVPVTEQMEPACVRENLLH